jgi:hypothetical protein
MFFLISDFNFIFLFILLIYVFDYDDVRTAAENAETTTVAIITIIRKEKK